MKKLITIFVLFNLLYAQNKATDAEPPIGGNMYNNILIDGQELTFKIKYGIICCVQGRILTSNTDHTFSGKTAMRIEFQAFTSNFVSVFAKINNYYQSYIDKNTMLPFYFSESVHENSFKRNRFTLFERDTKQAVTDDATYNIDSNTSDFLSLFFSIRGLNFDSHKPNTIIKTLEYVYYKAPTKVQLLYMGKETINSEILGKIECYKVAPIISDEAVFTDKAKTIMWVSNDNRRLPVKIQTSISWGVVDINLIGVRNINK